MRCWMAVDIVMYRELVSYNPPTFGPWMPERTVNTWVGDRMQFWRRRIRRAAR